VVLILLGELKLAYFVITRLNDYKTDNQWIEHNFEALVSDLKKLGLLDPQ